ncbi:MAG TPA: M1 family metallopeptidase [Firmicutes bacterium]|nr:M1 family metallopeptidase [Bacillota bacterium]
MTESFKQGLVFLAIVLLFTLPVAAGVNVFFHPASGFLRAEGEITVEPAAPVASFSLFPKAQITSLWLDGLLDYEIERGLKKTTVTFKLADLKGPQRLSISYEGFLPFETETGLVGEESYWFPKFDFPSGPVPINLRLAEGWQFIPAGEFEEPGEDVKGVFTWLPRGYPQFTVVPPAVPGPTEPAVDKPAQQGARGPEWEMREKAELFLRKLAARDEKAIEEILHPELQERGLAQYLAALPLEFGALTAEILSAGAKPGDPMIIVLKTEKGPRLQATLLWRESKLSSFSLMPYQSEIPPQVHSSLSDFVKTLAAAAAKRDRGLLEKLCSGETAGATVDFLLSLQTEKPWLLKHIALEPLTVSLLIEHSPTTTFILNLQLVPGADNWQINSLDIVFF